MTVPSNGRVIVEEFNGNLREIEADRLDRFTDDLLAKAVSEAVTTDPSLRFDHDVWQNYVVQKREIEMRRAARNPHGNH